MKSIVDRELEAVHVVFINLMNSPTGPMVRIREDPTAVPQPQAKWVPVKVHKLANAWLRYEWKSQTWDLSDDLATCKGEKRCLRSSRKAILEDDVLRNRNTFSKLCPSGLHKKHRKAQTL